MADQSVSIRPQGSAPGVARFDAAIAGRGFALHRHDCYALGLTLRGVQRFRYRGASWNGMPGQVHVLHPDELHDGVPGTAAGFAYRMVYLDPARVGEALGGGALPFVAAPLLDGADLSPWQFEGPLDALASHDLVQGLADLLARAAGRRPAPIALDRPALARVRECLAAAPERQPAMAGLEALSGLDRWTLARQFRLAYGVSPSGYRVQRQVARAQALMRAGLALAAAAAEAGFADQSHLTRQFRRTVGLTPARWRAALLRTPG
ncbi:AraC family transcriptional regulator [Roseateles sp. NT4]|uniref:AraC family transcriptional regulator n=1 Tax=Roseateles sp. NT4 TaxID=3453715 RepID=UPI003EED8076